MKYWLVAMQWMALATAMAAPTARPPVKPEGNRFLFVIETSVAMGRLEHGGRQAIFDLLHSGVDGRMRRGDTYGIWTFNEQVYSGLVPMQTWDPQKRLEQASAIGRFLKAQKYEKEGNIESLLQQLQAVARGAKDVNIFVVTDESATFTGTPFDESINDAYQAHRGEARAAKKPLLTTLVARNGEWTAACVTLAGEKILLGELPSETNAVLAAAEPDNAERKSEGPTNVAEKVTASPAATEAPRALLIEKKPKRTNIVIVATAPAPVPVTNTPVVSTTNAEVAVTPEPPLRDSVNTITNRAETSPEPLPSFVPGQIKASARTVPPPISVIAAPTVTRASVLPGLLLILGGVFVGASAIGGLLFYRKVRNARSPSFISQGMERE